MQGLHAPAPSSRPIWVRLLTPSRLPLYAFRYRPWMSSASSTVCGHMQWAANVMRVHNWFVGTGSFPETGRWCHIDMAYPVHDGERATGFGVALLTDLCARL